MNLESFDAVTMYEMLRNLNFDLLNLPHHLVLCMCDLFSSRSHFSIEKTKWSVMQYQEATDRLIYRQERVFIKEHSFILCVIIVDKGHEATMM